VEVVILNHYGKTLQVTDLNQSKSLDVITKDDYGSRVGFVEAWRWPLNLYGNVLDNVDVLLFGRVEKDDVEFLGWMDVSQISQAPVSWYEKDGKKISFSYVIEKEWISQPCEEFAFEVLCDHDFMYWNYYHDCWECFSCGNVRLCSEDAEKIKNEFRTVQDVEKEEQS